MYLKNGKYLTREGILKDNPGILVEDGKIKSIGESSDKDVIDCTGKIIFPGFVEAHCHTGLDEQDIGYEGQDYNEASDPVQADCRGIDAINPFESGIKDAMEGGITTFNAGPGSANVIGGTFCCLKSYGTCVDEMVVKKESAMKIAFGENPKRFYGQSKSKSPYTRMKIASLLREYINKAIEYGKDKDHKFDLGLEAFQKVINHEIPLKAHCHRADDIATAIRIAKEFDLDLTLDHVTEGHKIVDLIKNSGYSCIVGPSFGGRSKVELKDKCFETAGILANAGVKVAIMTDSTVIPLQDLTMCAMLAYRHGMKKEDAYKAITINAAEIIGVEDRVGSIEEGKDADFAIFNEDFMESTNARCVKTIIDGKVRFCEEV